MNLESALVALVPKPKPRGCKTCAWLDEQTDAVQDYVRTWVLEDHSPKQLYDVLVEHGFPLSLTGFKGHAEKCVRKAADDA